MSLRHCFKERGTEDVWLRLPDNTGKYKEEKCENCYCVRQTIIYDSSPQLKKYLFKKEGSQKFKGTILKCVFSYSRNYSYIKNENGPAIVEPKAETIADLKKLQHTHIEEVKEEAPTETITQARLDECLILIKLMKDKMEPRWVRKLFETEYRIASRILELHGL